MHGDVRSLIETIESAFGVRFEPGELGDDSHFEDLCRALLSRQGGTISHRCYTSIVFWRLRRALVEMLHVRKGSITPASAVDCLIPEGVVRRSHWRELSQASGLKLPGLEYSCGIGFAVVAAAVISALSISAAANSVTPPGQWGALAIVVAFAAAMAVTANRLFFVLLKPLATSVPAACANFGDLAKTVAGLNYGSLSREFGPSRRRDLVEALGYAIADLIDVDPRALVSTLTAENPSLSDIAEANDGFRLGV